MNPTITETLWTMCGRCRGVLLTRDVRQNLNVCPNCGYHFHLTSAERIAQLFGPEGFEELRVDVMPTGRPGFWDNGPYSERLAAERERSSLEEAAVIGDGRIGHHQVVFGMTDPSFLMGSIGSVVGEKLTQAVERAIHRRSPVLIVFCSSGARLQEGTLSLMQLAKISSALARLRASGGAFISVLTDPTFGGAAALAMLGDIVLAEPGALVGYTPPVLVAQVDRPPFPEGFQTSEFLLKNGFVDRSVRREDLRATIAALLDYLVGREPERARPEEDRFVFEKDIGDECPIGELSSHAQLRRVGPACVQSERGPL